MRLPFHGSLGLVPGCQARLWTLLVGEAVAQARAAGGEARPVCVCPVAAGTEDHEPHGWKQPKSFSYSSGG